MSDSRTGIQFVDESPAALNGSQGPFVVGTPLGKRTGADAGLDSDSDSEPEEVSQTQVVSGPRPGKKTKGRVKIKMEFIENKLRRYTTFSKRKTGIMKKAYELSTLTGTQVMLLVASETGHVYTFATRKLQPMITSDSGKALIQTCLNSPDTPPVTTTSNLDQRMNPTGFEEPELTYALSDDDQIKGDSPGMVQLYHGDQLISSAGDSKLGHASPPPAHSNALIKTDPFGVPCTTEGKFSSFNMQLPTTAPTSIVLSGPAGFDVGNSNTQQAIYRIPAQAPGQIFNLPAPAHIQSPPKDSITCVTSTAQTSSGNASGNTGTYALMYQTTQGLVYANSAGQPTIQGLPEGYIVNLPQGSNLQSLQEQQQTALQTGGQPQFITVPSGIPVSLSAGSTPVLQSVSSQIVTGQPASAAPQISRTK